MRWHTSGIQVCPGEKVCQYSTDVFFYRRASFQSTEQIPGLKSGFSYQNPLEGSILASYAQMMVWNFMVRIIDET
jgi:hypothetical protein